MNLFAFLEPYSEYKVSVKAFTFRFEGEVSDPIYQRTDVTAPSAPIVVNLTCHTQDDIYLKFRRPRTYYNSIDFYIISYRPQGANDFSKINLNSTIEHLEFSVNNANIVLNKYNLMNLISFPDGHTKPDNKHGLWG